MNEAEPASGAIGEPLAGDTSPEAERIQIEAWRRMSYAEKARLVSELNRTVRQLAFAGIRCRYPGSSERECFLRFALPALGEDLSCRVHPDARFLV